MSGKPDDASKIARANRLRLAAEEGARAMSEITKEASPSARTSLDCEN